MKHLTIISTLLLVPTVIPAFAETIECVEITSIPTTISQQGVYCLKGNLSSSNPAGSMITIATNNVTIDFNGYKLGGLGAGATTVANGIYAFDRSNIEIRNGVIRGFYYGIRLTGAAAGNYSGIRIEDMVIEKSRYAGMQAGGTNPLIRNNSIIQTGGNSTGSVRGIMVNNFASAEVIGNSIIFTNDTSFSYGILVDSGSIAEVRGNSIFDTINGSSEHGAVYVNISDSVAVIENRMINKSTTNGQYGVRATSSSNTLCADNLLSGFATALDGCNLSDNNRVN